MVNQNMILPIFCLNSGFPQDYTMCAVFIIVLPLPIYIVNFIFVIF